MVSVDGSIVLQIVNFLLLIWILNMVLYKPIRKILSERKAKVDGLETAIDDSAQQVVTKEKEYADGIRQARAAGQKEKETLMQAAMEEEKAIVGKINESAQAELKSVKAKIAAEMDTVKTALEEEIDAFADAIEQKILGRVA
ncbi:ATP synthase F0 subunit B [Desulfosarcina ovata]|uniref:ATP synthase subunit b n=2 Tax=Desulfosarcina ovata TaxID=83564 RepID=A0A5K8AJK2_9BACT|nr:ATP synthase F0 subunit B [Desulfosarcina ovata]BBO85648.1 ATP synthase subunit b [Desulfosarcina ovata subsp. sediminis]BBO92689.1 ATP synthase subunit b [Desulfosarcina ovata subsp. ovata]